MTIQRIPLVVLGAGYAGVTAANRLRASLTAEEAGRVRVALINRSGDFVERIRLHEVAAGTRATAARPLREMLHEDIDLIVGEVIRIEPQRKVIHIASSAGSRVQSYSSLIYAVGSIAAAGVPGAQDFAHLLANPGGAVAARDAIATLGRGQRITVVGGGPTGVEAAAEIAERRPETVVTLLSSDHILAFMPARARTRIGKTLARLGVQVRENARVVRVRRDGVELADGTLFPSDAVVWAASFAVPQLASISGLAVDGIGRLLVDESLRCIEYPEIVGAGDAVRPPPSVGAHLRMSCAMAIPLGGQAADTVLAQLRGTEPRPLSAGFVVQCLSLGRRKGHIQLVHPDDTPRRIHLTGAPAAKVKEMVCQLVVSGPQKERSKPGSAKTPHGPPPTPDERLTVDGPV